MRSGGKLPPGNKTPVFSGPSRQINNLPSSTTTLSICGNANPTPTHLASSHLPLPILSLMTKGVCSSLAVCLSDHTYCSLSEFWSRAVSAFSQTLQSTDASVNGCFSQTDASVNGYFSQQILRQILTGYQVSHFGRSLIDCLGMSSKIYVASSW